MRPVFLIGMPGAGKTWWGRRIAAHYGLHFYDLDAVIEEKEGISIASIFEQSGETYFRKRESELLAELIARADSPAIIACGGGTPVFNDNMQRMKNKGTVIYLRAQLSTILRHLQSDNVPRPLLTKKDIEAELEQLLRKRAPVYEKADHIFDVETLSVATFAKILA